MQCNNCGKSLIKIDRREEMVELDESATDGQAADYYASQLSGDGGAWNLAIIEYQCSQCETLYQIQHEKLPNYDTLISAWHDKADERDVFSKFIFEYLAFIAHIKNNIFYDAVNDRKAIQKLKRDSARREWYIREVTSHQPLKEAWEALIKELNSAPLYNSSHDLDNPEIDKWWNCSSDQPNGEDPSPKGRIMATDDWENMVEFWYSVRNNLFHGGKSPQIQRDYFLVELAHKTLRAFMTVEIGGLR